MYFDIHGLIVQPDGDGGDSAQRVGMYYFLLAIWEKLGLSIMNFPNFSAASFQRCLNHLEVEPGIYRRHPDMWNDPNDFSRDQQTPLVLAMGVYNFRYPLQVLFIQHLKRFFKYQNKDWASPEHVGFYVRAFGFKIFYPILFLGDLFMLLNSFFICFYHARDKNFSDDQNHILALTQAIYSMPTPLSWLARMVYIYCRPENRGNTELGEKNPVMGAIAWYHNPRHNGINEFVRIWRPVIEKHFTPKYGN